MDTKEVQTNSFDTEALQKEVTSLRENLEHLRVNNSFLNAGMYSQNDKLKQMEYSIENGCDSFASLENTLGRVTRQLSRNQGDIYRMNKTIKNLEVEKAKILKEEMFFKGIDANVSMSAEERTERRLIGFAKSDLDTKIQDLQDITDIVELRDDEAKQEWRAFKEDIQKYRTERRPYELEIKNFNNTAIAKLREMAKYQTDDDEGKATSNAIAKALRYLECDREIKDMKSEYLDLQIISRDLDIDIARLREKQKRLLCEHDKVQYFIDKVNSRDKKTYGYALHKTGRHTDLPHRDEEVISEDEELAAEQETEITEYEHFGGKVLHRCTKRTNIALPPEAWEESDDATEIAQPTINAADGSVSDEESESESSSETDESSDGETKKVKYNPQEVKERVRAQMKKVLEIPLSNDKIQKHSDTGPQSLQAAHTMRSEITMEGASQVPSQSLVSKLRSRLGAVGGASTSSSNLSKKGPKNQGMALGKQSSAKYPAEMFVAKMKQKKK